MKDLSSGQKWVAVWNTKSCRCGFKRGETVCCYALLANNVLESPGRETCWQGNLLESAICIHRSAQVRNARGLCAKGSRRRIRTSLMAGRSLSLSTAHQPRRLNPLRDSWTACREANLISASQRVRCDVGQIKPGGYNDYQNPPQFLGAAVRLPYVRNHQQRIGIGSCRAVGLKKKLRMKPVISSRLIAGPEVPNDPAGRSKHVIARKCIAGICSRGSV